RVRIDVKYHARSAIRLPSAAAARGSQSKIIPRFVLVLTADAVASTAPRIRAPTLWPLTVSGPEAAAALRLKSLTSKRRSLAKTWPFPGFGAPSSSRQASSKAPAIWFRHTGVGSDIAPGPHRQARNQIARKRGGN